MNEKIKNSFKIKEHLEFALKANPEDATVIFALGKWCFTISEKLGNMMLRAVVSTIFTKPPHATYDEAIEYFMKVEDLLKGPRASYYADLRIRNKVMLGDCYYQQGHYDKAKNWYQAALNYEAISIADKKEQEQAKNKIGKCSGSWW